MVLRAPTRSPRNATQPPALNMAFVTPITAPTRSASRTATCTAVIPAGGFAAAPSGGLTAARRAVVPQIATRVTMATGSQGKAYTAIVTGASSSIGLYAAKELAARGDYHVVMACRDVMKGEKAARDMGMPEGSYSVLELDLASLGSVRNFVKNFQIGGYRALNALVCNAAIWYPRDKAPRFTVDGYDETVQVNHLGHFLLANSLLPQLKFSKGRVVFLATETHNPDTIPGMVPPQADLGELQGLASGFTTLPGTIDGKAFEPTKAYKDSKICNILTMTEMHRRFATQGVVVSAVFPGCIAESNLFREKRSWFRTLFPLFQKYVTKQFVDTSEAGRRVALVASDPRFGDSGKYWQWRGSYLKGADKTIPTPIPPTERESDKAEKLWEISSKLVGLSSPLVAAKN